jgi:hypothetical protein
MYLVTSVAPKISSLELFWDGGKAVSVKLITELEIGEDISPPCWFLYCARVEMWLDWSTKVLETSPSTGLNIKSLNQFESIPK